LKIVNLLFLIHKIGIRWSRSTYLLTYLLYYKQVPEDYPVDEPVFVVRAEDEDRGNNAELSYILETASQLQYGQIFRLHRTSGEVCVTRWLIAVTVSATVVEMVAAEISGRTWPAASYSAASLNCGT